MERFDAGIVIWIPLAAEGMEHPFSGQTALKCHAGVLAPEITVEDNACRIRYIQAGICYSLYCQFRCHGGAICITDDFAAA